MELGGGMQDGSVGSCVEKVQKEGADMRVSKGFLGGSLQGPGSGPAAGILLIYPVQRSSSQFAPLTRPQKLGPPCCWPP